MFDTTLRYSAHNPFVTIHLFVRSSNTPLHTRLIELQLTAVCFVLPFSSPTRSVSGSRSFRPPSRELYATLILVIGGLFERCSIYLLMCVCVVCTMNTLVAFAYVTFSLSISICYYCWFTYVQCIYVCFCFILLKC